MQSHDVAADDGELSDVSVDSSYDAEESLFSAAASKASTRITSPDSATKKNADTEKERSRA